MKSEKVTVLVTLFVIALGYGVILPVLPFYTERLALGGGASSESITFQVAFLTSIYPFFQMIFAPLWGRWSDKFGRRRLILIGIIGFILMQLFIGISTSLWMLYLARIIGGVFTSAIIPVSYALISDFTLEENRASGFAYAGASYSLGIVAGPFIGGLLSRKSMHLDFEFGHFLINDYSIPFLLLALVGIMLLPVVWRGLRGTLNYQSKFERNVSTYTSPSNWRQLVGILSPLLMLSFIYQTALTLFEAVFSIHSKNELQFDAISIGYGFMICALIMALLQPLAVSKGMRDKINGSNQIIFGYLVFGLGILSLIFANDLILVLILIGILAAGGAFIIPNITSEISLKGENASGSALGIQKSIDGLGQTIGPILGSWLLNINPSLPYLLTGTSLLIISLLLFKFQ